MFAEEINSPAEDKKPEEKDFSQVFKPLPPTEGVPENEQTVSPAEETSAEETIEPLLTEQPNPVEPQQDTEQDVSPASVESEVVIEPQNALVESQDPNEAEPEVAAPKTDEKKWYVIQTFSGQEEKVKRSLEHAIAELNMGHKIFKVLVPEEETVEIKGKKRVEIKKKMFPGYIFIEMLLDDESWYVIRSIPGVSKFIGTKTKPTPVLDREMQRVLKQIGIKAERLEVNFEVGETVRVISGPFRGYTGTINEINVDRGRLKVLINIFGRDTPVEVNFEHAQKIV